MKVKFPYIIYIFLLSGAFTKMFTQESSLERFTASEVKSKVYLEWIIKAGSTCQGIRILRSIDKINFLQIGDIGGVCGNINTPQLYNFTDDNPVKNKTNYYRLELGGIGLSNIVSVVIIDFQNNKYQVRPNPVTSHSIIYFVNELDLPYQLNVYSLDGSEIFHSNTVHNYAFIHNYELQSGIYVFTISRPGVAPLVTGKFMVAH